MCRDLETQIKVKVIVCIEKFSTQTSSLRRQNLHWLTGIINKDNTGRDSLPPNARCSHLAIHKKTMLIKVYLDPRQASYRFKSAETGIMTLLSRVASFNLSSPRMVSPKSNHNYNYNCLLTWLNKKLPPAPLVQLLLFFQVCLIEQTFRARKEVQKCSAYM